MKRIKYLMPILGMTTIATVAMPLTSCAGNTGGGEEGGGGSEESTGVKSITTDTTLTSGEFSSTTSNQNAVLVNGKITANLSNLTLNKTGDYTSSSQGDDGSSFYGTNSALLAKGGSTVVLDNLNVTTNAKGANGVFAYGGKSSNSGTGDGTNITISNSTINTSKDQSGGIMVAGHGSLTATNCNVTTQGGSSAAIRSDKGGETMNVSGGTYTTNGSGSPAVYSTATINVSNATLTSNHSEGVIVEGSNKVTLTNCVLEDTNDKLNGQSTSYKNIFLYQSMSGDAGSGGDSFSATNCTIKTHNGDDIYVTNQTSTITLKNNTFTNDSTGSHYFLRVQKDAWGTSGSNGGNVTLTFDNQTVENRNIYVDNISKLDWTLKNDSIFKGVINGANGAKMLKLTVETGSKIILTGNSYVTEDVDEDTLSCIDVGSYHLYKGSTILK